MVFGDGVGAIVDEGAVAVIGAAAVGSSLGSLFEEQALKATRVTSKNAIDFNAIYQGLPTDQFKSCRYYDTVQLGVGPNAIVTKEATQLQNAPAELSRHLIVTFQRMGA